MTEINVKALAQVDSSRIRVLNAPILAPGTCAVCGASRNDDRKYVDIGIDVDFIGTIYFCTYCVLELVNTLGCLMPEQANTLIEELDAARKTILDFQQDKAALDDAITTLRGTGLFSGTDLSSITNPVQVTEPEPEHPQDIVGSEPKSSKSGKSTKQSDSKQGPPDLPEFGSDDFTSLI